MDDLNHCSIRLRACQNIVTREPIGRENMRIEISDEHNGRATKFRFYPHLST